MFGVDVANITRMLIVYTQGVVGFGIADQAGLPWKYFEDFSNRVIKTRRRFRAVVDILTL